MCVKKYNNVRKNKTSLTRTYEFSFRFLATGQTYGELHFSFRIAESTICCIIMHVLRVIWEVYQPIFMPVLTTDKLKDVADDFFNEFGYPHCCGALDAKHIRKEIKSSLFYNYKKFYSYKLQALVDSRYRFLAVDVGDYGRNHDSQTFRKSSLHKELQLILPKPGALPDSPTILPYFVIADGAYRLEESVMKPFRKSSGKE